MPRHDKGDSAFLEIGFRSPSRNGVQIIELCGVPGYHRANGEADISEGVRNFFDDLIARKIFRASRAIPDCNFRAIKIWLRDTDVKDADRGYFVPSVDENDLTIDSPRKDSTLRRIIVLDNRLEGKAYRIWREDAREIFMPIFSSLVVPLEPPRLPPPFAGIAEMIYKTVSQLDIQANAKRQIFFNELIIQID